MCCPVPDISTDELKEQCAEYNKPPPPPPMGRGGPPKFNHHHHHHPPPVSAGLYIFKINIEH